MATLGLPLSEGSLGESHDTARGDAMQVFDQQHFGRHHAKKSIVQLDEEINKVLLEYLSYNGSLQTKICLLGIQLAVKIILSN